MYLFLKICFSFEEVVDYHNKMSLASGHNIKLFIYLVPITNTENNSAILTISQTEHFYVSIVITEKS